MGFPQQESHRSSQRLNSSKLISPCSQADSFCRASAPQAYPAVFVKGYSRELYDALRESIVTGERSRTFTLSNEAMAHCFIFLCDMADIPCILVHSDVHQWNEVYVDGRWWSVDVGGFDCWEPAQRQRATVLHDTSEMQGEIFEQSDPALTEFVKELLVPGSTLD